MAIYVMNQNSRNLPSIGSIQIDATISEDHNYSNDVTDHPIENGASISDTIIQKPFSLSMECIVSASPLSDKVTDSTPQRVDRTYAALARLAQSKSLVTVVTAVRTYTNMAISTLSVPRSKDDGNSLRFNVTFKQIKIVSAQIDITKLEGNDTLLGVAGYEPPILDYNDYEEIEPFIPVIDNTRVYGVTPQIRAYGLGFTGEDITPSTPDVPYIEPITFDRSLLSEDEKYRDPTVDARRGLPIQTTEESASIATENKININTTDSSKDFYAN